MLPSLTVAFLLGLLCGAQLPFFPLTLIGVLLAGAVAITLFERAGSLDPQFALALYLSLLSGVVYWTLVTPAPQPPEPSTDLRNSVQRTVTGKIASFVQHGENRQTILIQTDDLLSEPHRVRLVWRDPGLTLHYGDRIAFHGNVHRPTGTLNPGGFDYRAYLQRQGIDLVATVVGHHAVRILDAESQTGRWNLWNRIDQWRTGVREAAIRTLSQPTLGLYLGMIIGERGYLEQELQDWFMATGTVHLLSISGSHLGLVAVVCFWMLKQAVLSFPSNVLLRITRKITPTKIAILFTWPAVALYAVLAGAELATIRSLVMISLGMVALWLGYERHLGHAIAAALLVIVLHDPRAIFDISFQLSFLSVWVMIHALSMTRSRDEVRALSDGDLKYRAMDYGVKALLVGGAVTLTTLPLVAFYFNQVPWMGIVTNMVAIPFTGIVLVPLGLVVALWTIMSGLDALPFGSGLGHLFGWLAYGLRWCAGIPGGEWHVAAPSIPTLALFYLGVLLASVRVIPRSLRMTAVGGAFALLGWWGVVPGSHGDGDSWRVTFLDVGQGDSAVVELPDGQIVLIDGGARHERFDMGRSVVAPFLWNRGIRHIDHVIGTHQQLDHVGGLIWILQHMSVGQFWDQGIERPEKFVQDIRAALRLRGITERVAMRGQEVLHASPCRFHILNPVGEAAPPDMVRSYSGTALNNHSIVSRLECGAHSVLFAADIEVGGLSLLPSEGRQPVTVLKVPHHGARSSLDRGWLRQVHPQYAVISVGATNPYGHPFEAVVNAYHDEDIAVYRTDREGAVWVSGRLSTSEITVSGMRELVLQPVDLLKYPWRSELQNWHRLLQSFA